MSTRNIENPDTLEEIREAREELTESGDDEDALPGEKASPQELQESRETVANEQQPSRDHLPGKEPVVVSFRGHDFEFDEDPSIVEELTEFHENDNKSESELRAWAIVKLGDLCLDPAADKDYWGQFAVSRSDDKDALVDVLLDVAGAPDPEEQRQAQQFRNQ